MCEQSGQRKAMFRIATEGAGWIAEPGLLALSAFHSEKHLSRALQMLKHLRVEWRARTQPFGYLIPEDLYIQVGAR